ncbi:hypothetical protein JCM10450v2_003390 [Rhodotorula kratochvilovae]
MNIEVAIGLDAPPPPRAATPAAAAHSSAEGSRDQAMQGDRARDGRGDLTPQQETEDDESLAEWMARYRIGRAGASDETPAPPAAIRAILEGRDRGGASVSSASTSTQSSGRPDSPASITSAESPTGSVSSLPSINSLTATALLDFYRRKGHFPAPPGPYEEERLRLAHKYGLDQPIRRKAIDRICGLAKAYFKTKAVVISLTFDDHQVLGAERGWGGEEPTMNDPPRPLTMEPAFCTHAMLASYRDPKAVFIVGDADKDWRFSSNPYTVANGGGLAFYAAANVSLPVAPSSRTASGIELPATLASGALCLVDPVPRAPSDFGAEERQILTDFAEMISREFVLGFEQRRREQEAKQSEFIDAFLRKALVLPSQSEALRPLAATAPSTRPSTAPNSPRQRSPSRASDSTTTPTPSHASYGAPRSRAPSPSPSQPESLFQLAARQLRAHTYAGSAAVLDLRAFRTANVHTPLRHPNPAQAGHYFHSSANTSPIAGGGGREDRPAPVRRESLGAHFWRVAGDSTASRPPTPPGGAPPAPGQNGRVTLMGADGDVEWLSMFERARQGVAIGREVTISDAVEDVLQSYYRESPENPENSFVDAAPFVAAGLIPAHLGAASACIPVFDIDGAPIVLIVLTSGEKWFSFEPNDRRFAASVGAIVVGSLLRQRALEADLAKLRFVSHVSHELRTPLHGCNSQIELIREFASPAELRKLAPLLDAADVCLESLSDVLNDTLDFSKLSQSLSTSPEEQAEYRRRAFAQSALDALVEGVTKSTWVRKQRVDAVTADLGKAADGAEPREGKVDLLLEVEERRGGWRAMIDVGGLKRVLLNLVGNALKFTREGEVKISLREIGVLPSSPQFSPDTAVLDRRLVSITVRDTGIGMSDEFIRDGSYLTPFLQADPFVSGAGLGLSIVDSIVKRMGGKLDVASQLGVGTAMTVTLPLDFLASESSPPPSPPSSPYLPRIIRRNVSEELGRLLQPSTGADSAASSSTGRARAPPGLGPLPLASAHVPAPMSTTPISELDFDQAVSAMQASLLPPPAPTSPLRSPRSQPAQLSRGGSLRRPGEPPRKLSARADDEELAVEAAKLSIGSVGDVKSRMVPMADPMDGLPPEEEKAPSRGARRRVRVLVAEDNPIARNILIKLLNGKGIPFSAAEDGQEAVELFEAAQGAFTLFLCDVQMPRLDGIEASRQVRRLEAERGWAPLRIIALTGLSNDADMQKALGKDGPVDEWVVKGGRSLRIILEEVAALQKELDEEDGALEAAVS